MPPSAVLVCRSSRRPTLLTWNRLGKRSKSIRRQVSSRCVRACVRANQETYACEYVMWACEYVMWACEYAMWTCVLHPF